MADVLLEQVRPGIVVLTLNRPERLNALTMGMFGELLDACAQLADTLLRACPGVQILATSREALGLAGEFSRRVPSLTVPPVDPLATTATGIGTPVLRDVPTTFPLYFAK